MSTPLLPEKWCINASAFTASYEPHKIYLGHSKHTSQHVYVNIEILFKDEADMKSFFDWYKVEVLNKNNRFYARVPLWGNTGHYLFAQDSTLTQRQDPYSVKARLLLLNNKTKEDNLAPIANDVTVTVTKNKNVMYDLDATDPDGGEISYHMVSLPSNGTRDAVVVGTDIYRPNKDFIGVDSYTYKVYDGVAFSNIATVTINVTDTP